MVDETTTDGTRIAELLASEVDGLAVGPLDAVSVVDADPDAAPSEDGTYAYGIEFGDEGIGEVRIRPAAAVLVLDDGQPAPSPADMVGLSIDGDALVVERGAAVKAAVDVLRSRLEN